jgi:hypothetical protein
MSVFEAGFGKNFHRADAVKIRLCGFYMSKNRRLFEISKKEEISWRFVEVLRIAQSSSLHHLELELEAFFNEVKNKDKEIVLVLHSVLLDLVRSVTIAGDEEKSNVRRHSALFYAASIQDSCVDRLCFPDGVADFPEDLITFLGRDKVYKIAGIQG